MILASATSGLGGFGHELGKITEVSLPIIFLIGLAIHFIFARRAGVVVHHYVGALLLGGLAGVAFPKISLWFGHLGTGSRATFDIFILLIAFSDIVIQILGRVSSIGQQ